MTSSENGRVERLVFPDQDDERRLWESVVGHATLWAAPICGLGLLLWTTYR